MRKEFLHSTYGNKGFTEKAKVMRKTPSSTFFKMSVCQAVWEWSTFPSGTMRIRNTTNLLSGSVITGFKDKTSSSFRVTVKSLQHQQGPSWWLLNLHKLTPGCFLTVCLLWSTAASSNRSLSLRVTLFRGRSWVPGQSPQFTMRSFMLLLKMKSASALARSPTSWLIRHIDTLFSKALTTSWNICGFSVFDFQLSERLASLLDCYHRGVHRKTFAVYAWPSLGAEVKSLCTSPSVRPCFLWTELLLSMSGWREQVLSPPAKLLSALALTRNWDNSMF